MNGGDSLEERSLCTRDAGLRVQYLRRIGLCLGEDSVAHASCGVKNLAEME